jgi:hypothetical protein
MMAILRIVWVTVGHFLLFGLADEALWLGGNRNQGSEIRDQMARKRSQHTKTRRTLRHFLLYQQWRIAGFRAENPPRGKLIWLTMSRRSKPRPAKPRSPRLVLVCVAAFAVMLLLLRMLVFVQGHGRHWR